MPSVPRLSEAIPMKQIKRWWARGMIAGVVLALGSTPALAQMTGGGFGGAGTGGAGAGGVRPGGATGAGGFGGAGTGTGAGAGATTPGQTGAGRTAGSAATIPSQSNPFRTYYSNGLMDGLGNRITLAIGGGATTSVTGGRTGGGSGLTGTGGGGGGSLTGGGGSGFASSFGAGSGARSAAGGGAAGATGGVSGTNLTIATFGQPLYTATTGTGAGATGGGLTGGARTGGIGGAGLGNTATQGNGFSTVGTIRSPSYITTIGDTIPMPKRPTAIVVQSNLQGVIDRSSALNGPKNVKVDVSDQTVFLRGTVSSDRERRLAESLLRLTPGVRDVRNELEVVENKKP
jgi:hypothetical protein